MVARARVTKSRRALPHRLAWLAALYAVFICAPVLAPYDPDDQHRELASAPPTPVRWRHTDGRWEGRPFVYALAPTAEGYREDTTRVFHVRFWVQAERRDLNHGLVPVARAFGVDRPGHVFVLGTDRYGRDRWSRLLIGGRLSLAAGLLAAALSVGIGWVFGGMAGVLGGWVDGVLMRAVELFLAMPWLYLLLAARVALPLNIAPTRAFFLVVVLIGVAGWARPARLVRSAVLGVRASGFVEAARSAGASRARILARHVLPHTMPVVATQIAILVPQFTMAEMTLSFFGLGVAEPAPSWGGLLAEQSRDYLLQPSWITAAPIVAVATVFVLYQGVADELSAPRMVSS